MHPTNINTVVDLKKVSYANYYYTNASDTCRLRTITSSLYVNGSPLNEPDNFALPYLHEYPRETREERARRLMILDNFKPTLVLQLTNSHTLTFSGDKATKLWKAWNKQVRR